MARGDFQHDPGSTARQAAVDNHGAVFPTGGPDGGDIPMVGGLLDLDALRLIAERERDEAKLVEEIETSVAGREAIARTRFLAARSSGFPKSLDLAAFFGTTECVLADDGDGWRLRTATFEDRDRRRKPWRSFDLDSYVTHLLTALGMEGSRVAHRSIMSVLASEPTKEAVIVEERREPDEQEAHQAEETDHTSESDDGTTPELTEGLTEGPPSAQTDDGARPTEPRDTNAGDDGSRASTDDVLRSVLHALSDILAEPLSKEGRGYVTPSGRRVKLSMSSPYRGTDGRNFKVSPDHFAYDIFVIWKSEGGGGWAIPTGKLRDFLECTPMPNRSGGQDSWDPRIATEDGNNWLWTYARRYGRLDVTPYVF